MRKTPKQQRSVQLVNSLVEAAVAYLEQNGLGEFTTNAVAEKAGVSIGSLYQYFENADDLLDAVSDRLTDEVIIVLRQTIADGIALEIDGLAYLILDRTFGYLEERPKLVAALLRANDQARSFRAIERLENAFIDEFRHYALRHHQDLAVSNLPMAAFVAFTSFVSVGIRMQIVNRAGVDREEVLKMLVKMCVAAVSAEPPPN